MSYQIFCEKYPAYTALKELDTIRATEYPLLNKENHVYLDYTGANLFSKTQIEAHASFLQIHVFGNPHSTNPTSAVSTRFVEDTRKAVLSYFHASDDYYCVFTANATQSLKIIGESYPFDPHSHFLLLFDNHNSVNGIREKLTKLWLEKGGSGQGDEGGHKEQKQTIPNS